MIKLRNFSLEGLALEKIEHYVLTRKLTEDEATKNYISKRFSNWIEEPSKQEQLEVGKTYVVYGTESEIGMIETSKLDQQGVLEFWCVLQKEQRGKRKGDQLLGEITPYLIENVIGLEDIKLVINKDNHSSNEVAIKNGYLLESKEADKNIYYYFGNNHKTVEKHTKM